MRKSTLILLSLVVVGPLVLLGCSGSGDGDGDDGNGAPVDTALAGTWQPYMASADGEQVAPAAAFGWDEGVVGMWIEFGIDGTVTVRHYDEDGVVDTENGTWTAQNGSGTLTIEGEQTDITYAADGRVMVITFVEDGAELTTRWVPVVEATEQAAQLARAWQVTQVQVNGSDETLADFFDVPAGSTVVLGMMNEGALHFFVLDAEGDILEHMAGAWATRDELLAIQPPGSAMTLRGVWAADNTSVTFLDEDGSTARFELTAWAAAGDRDTELPGEWTAQSVTVNGEAVDMADFFDWAQGTDRMLLDLWTDGTAVVREMSAAGDVFYGQLGTWNTDGGDLTLDLDEEMVMGYAVTDTTLTTSLVDDGNAIEITWTRTN